MTEIHEVYTESRSMKSMMETKAAEEAQIVVESFAENISVNVVPIN